MTADDITAVRRISRRLAARYSVDADDVESDAVLAVWRRESDHSPERGTWDVYRLVVARSAGMDAARREMARRCHSLIVDRPGPASPLDVLLAREMAETILASDAPVLVDCVTRDVTFAEHARERGVSRQAVTKSAQREAARLMRRAA